MTKLVKYPQWVFDEANAILDHLDWKTTTPSRQHALRFTEIGPSDVKMVILGQDPYPAPGVANGRAFASGKSNYLPASLRNVYAEIVKFQGQVFTDSSLDLWASQGVLLLNTALTTQVNLPRAHYELWVSYTAKVIQWLDETNPAIIWVLWGHDAAEVGRQLKGKKLFDAHPSPLSAHRRVGEPFRSIDWIKW